MSNKFIDLIAFNETRLDANITDNMTNLGSYMWSLYLPACVALSTTK